MNSKLVHHCPSHQRYADDGIQMDSAGLRPMPQKRRNLVSCMRDTNSKALSAQQTRWDKTIAGQTSIRNSERRQQHAKRCPHNGDSYSMQPTGTAEAGQREITLA